MSTWAARNTWARKVFLYDEPWCELQHGYRIDGHTLWSFAFDPCVSGDALCRDRSRCLYSDLCRQKLRIAAKVAAASVGALAFYIAAAAAISWVSPQRVIKFGDSYCWDLWCMGIDKV